MHVLHEALYILFPTQRSDPYGRVALNTVLMKCVVMDAGEPPVQLTDTLK